MQKIGKQIWNQRHANGWIIVELTVICVLLWYTIDLVYNYEGAAWQPKGYDTENVFDLLSFGKTVMISALKGTNLDLLLKEIEKVLELKNVTLDLLIPFSKGGEVNTIRNNGKILSEEFTPDGTKIKVILPVEWADRYKEYVL